MWVKGVVTSHINIYQNYFFQLFFPEITHFAKAMKSRCISKIPAWRVRVSPTSICPSDWSPSNQYNLPLYTDLPNLPPSQPPPPFPLTPSPFPTHCSRCWLRSVFVHVGSSVQRTRVRNAPYPSISDKHLCAYCKENALGDVLH